MRWGEREEKEMTREARERGLVVSGEGEGRKNISNLWYVLIFKFFFFFTTRRLFGWLGALFRELLGYWWWSNKKNKIRFFFVCWVCCCLCFLTLCVVVVVVVVMLCCVNYYYYYYYFLETNSLCYFQHTNKKLIHARIWVWRKNSPQHTCGNPCLKISNDSIQVVLIVFPLKKFFFHQTKKKKINPRQNLGVEKKFPTTHVWKPLLKISNDSIQVVLIVFLVKKIFFSPNKKKQKN